MADNGSRRGAANLSMPLMIAAFIVIGGFLYWLNLQAQAERAAELAEDAAQEEVAATLSGGTLVAGADIQMDPSPYEGQQIRLEDMPIASALGTQGFWVEMPNRNPFLISMSEGVKAEGLAIVPGQTASMVGTIYAMGDSVLNEWSGTAAIGEGDRLAAEFATHFLEATAVVVSESAAGGS